jgi:hypothetical protein
MTQIQFKQLDYIALPFLTKVLPLLSATRSNIHDCLIKFRLELFNKGRSFCTTFGKL